MASAADSAQDWLMKMNRAADALNYDGVFVYQFTDQLQTMRIIHRADGNSRRERLVSLSGVGREVIRNDREVRCYLPDENTVLVEHRKSDGKSFPNLVPKSLTELERNYDIRLGKTGRVANRKVQSVIIRPKDGYRYGYHLWADTETGLLLKAYLIDNPGTIIEQFVFTQVSIGTNIPESDLEPQNKGKDYVWHRELAPDNTSLPGASKWTAASLPRGFSLYARMLRKIPNRELPVEQLVFSDGLSVVSVFIERFDSSVGTSGRSGNLNGLTARGALHAYGKYIGSHQITAVGEAPSITIRQISQAITPVHNATGP
jgi:sigma-E factor negative regulatory protein RseB